MVDIWRVRTQLQTTATNPMLNTFFFAADLVTVSAARTSVQEFWAALGSAMTQNLTWVIENEVEKINVETGALVGVVVDSTNYTGNGTVDSEELPQATQGLIRWGTGAIVSGRRLQGHTFIPGATESLSSDGVPSSALLDKYTTAAAILATGGDDACVIWSRRHHTSAVASSGRPWTEFAVLRSRRS